MGNNLKNLLKTSVANSMSYDQYRILVHDLLLEQKSTGHTQNEDYLNYSLLSERRMKRWDKTFKLSKEDYLFFQNWDKSVIFLTISEGWCGDAAHALPILNVIAKTTTQIDLKIILRDDNDEVMTHFLTNGGKSIPKLIALDNDFEILFTWGPRPSVATKLVNDYKNKHGKLTPEFKEELQRWYNKDKGITIVKDIKEKLSTI